MQYLHDNLKMHTICGGKVQYPHYDHNPHYIWERETLEEKPLFTTGVYNCFLVERDIL
jgi:hypothetical protein